MGGHPTTTPIQIIFRMFSQTLSWYLEKHHLSPGLLMLFLCPESNRDPYAIQNCCMSTSNITVRPSNKPLSSQISENIIVYLNLTVFGTRNRSPIRSGSEDMGFTTDMTGDAGIPRPFWSQTFHKTSASSKACHG